MRLIAGSLIIVYMQRMIYERSVCQLLLLINSYVLPACV